MRILLSVLFSIWMSSAALAHVSLVSSMPADGAQLTDAPTMVMLTFSDVAKVTSIELENDNGETIKVTELPNGMAAMAHINLPALTSGNYTLNWHAASKDMHVMSGSFKFSIR